MNANKLFVNVAARVAQFTRRVGMVSLVAFAVCSLPANAQIVILNHSFEANTNTGVGYGPISDWGTIGAGVGINASNALAANRPFLGSIPPRHGTNVAFIQGVGSITQSISGYDPTKLYTVTYFVNERGDSSSSAMTNISVSLNGGTTVYTNQHDSIRKTDRFRRIVSGPLAVSGATSTLRIDSGAPVGDSTLLLDAVSITRAVPAVPDGGFERPKQPNDQFKLGGGAGGGSLAGSAWTFSGFAGIADNGSAFSAPTALEGSQVGVLQSTSFFFTAVSGFENGVTYSLSFEAAGRGGGFGPNEFRVLLDGALLSFGGVTTNTPTVGSWTTYTSDSFTTTGGVFTLRFEGLNLFDKTSFIDDIRFNFIAEAAVVPEPSMLALISLGLVALGWWHRRREP